MHSKLSDVQYTCIVTLVIYLVQTYSWKIQQFWNLTRNDSNCLVVFSFKALRTVLLNGEL